MKATTHRDLRVWQEALKLAGAMRPICNRLHALGRRHMAEQLESATTSVHANVAEGRGRTGRGDRLRFFGFAWASLQEVESHLAELALDPHLAPDQRRVAQDHVRPTARLLSALRRSL